MYFYLNINERTLVSSVNKLSKLILINKIVLDDIQIDVVNQLNAFTHYIFFIITVHKYSDLKAIR